MFLLLLCLANATAQVVTPVEKNVSKDSIISAQDTLNTSFKDTLKEHFPRFKEQFLSEAAMDSISKDSIRRDSIKRTKSPLKTKISYQAKDYVTIDRNTNKIYFYNEAKIDYGDIQLSGGVMEMDYEKKEIYNGRIKDTSGTFTQLPIFKQRTNEVKPDSIRFNYSTKKSMIWNSRTKQNDGSSLLSERVKKINDSVLYTRETYVTTSADLENPEYYFRLRKSKLIPNKRIITGLTNMYIAGVPTPIGLPFASFPLGNNNSSGIIFPTYGQGGNRGFFLQNGGYYLTLGDYFDIRITGDYYTSATYGIKLQSTYKLRYRFAGGINISYENLVSGERGFSDYSKSVVYNIRWNHRKDQKSGPNSSFSASVNIGSSTYYRQSLNQLNSPNFLNNTLSSSISYSKNFPINPAIRTSITLTHSQNNNTKLVNMSLPTFQASLDRIYPFAPKEGSKKGLLENINFQYNLNAQNRISTSDSLLFTDKMFDKAKNGVQHTIPIATNFKVMKYLSVSLTSSITENWSFQTIRYKDYDIETKEAKLDTVRRFDRFGKYSFSAGLGTTIYGTFLFGENSKIQGIRHIMKPSVTLSYAPDQKDLYNNYVSDERGTLREYTRFQGGVYGSPTKNSSGSIGFNLQNDFEAKVKNKDTTKIEPRKVRFLNNLNFSTSYNALADSLKWSPVSMSASTSLLKNKLSVNLRGSLDPYAINANGSRINTPAISRGGGLFRLTNANVNLSYSIASTDFKKNKKENQQADEQSQSQQNNIFSGGRPDNLFGQSIQSGLSRNRNTKSTSDKEKPYYKFSIPWRISFTQSLTYNNQTGDGKFEANSLMFSGSFDPAPRWSIGFNSGFDFENKGFTYTQINFQRDLKSWQMSFSWTPTSATPTWYFFIGIKASLFKDIKFEERGKPDRSF